MYQQVSVVVSMAVVCVCELHLSHGNISSGDLLDASDYSEPIEPVAEDAPSWIRHDSFQHTSVYVDIRYGDQDVIQEVSKEKLLMQKKPVPNSDMNEIWYIPYEDRDLQLFFAKVLDLDPDNLTIEHVAVFRAESAIKKILIKRMQISDEQIVERLKAALQNN
ncbi:uncharacterized protein LOC128996118 [Macrosteles quadrilineatus]|uniref:uncharacterized protein LOC128996118 n=1 Tax=Macrosteles quadrilineatus TaxID=74068 RepID=UPI0023E219A7|nr:uncharacterized protein LOC128996118 [Macrosteles quadrilineatus]